MKHMKTYEKYEKHGKTLNKMFYYEKTYFSGKNRRKKRKTFSKQVKSWIWEVLERGPESRIFESSPVGPKIGKIGPVGAERGIQDSK